MGIGEQAFEARFERELAALRSTSRNAGVVGGVYVNDAVGLAFPLPPGWSTRDLREVERVAEGRLLYSHQEHVNDAFRSVTSAHLPLVVIAAPELDDPAARLGPHELGPVVTVHEEWIAGDERADFDLWRHTAIDLAHFHGAIEDYRLLTPPARTTLSGCDAVSYRADYTLLHADAVEGCTMRERACYVGREHALYEVRMCDFPGRHPRLVFDYDRFVQGICFR